MTPRSFWITATGTLAVLLVISWRTAGVETFPPVAWTFVATFAGAAVGAILIVVLAGSPLAAMAATLGRSMVSILGVVLVWLLLEPAPKPILGAFVIGYFVFLGLETALAFSLSRDPGPAPTRPYGDE